MNKEQMITVLRSVGVSESTITVMSNAFDLGFESAKDQATQIALGYDEQFAADISKLTP
jgi:hypothetical protein